MQSLFSKRSAVSVEPPKDVVVLRAPITETKALSFACASAKVQAIMAKAASLKAEALKPGGVVQRVYAYALFTLTGKLRKEAIHVAGHDAAGGPAAAAGLHTERSLPQQTWAAPTPDGASWLMSCFKK